MKDKKKEKSEKLSYILTKETVGTSLLLFSVIVLLMLFSHTAIFASIGGAVCTLLYGTFGYGSLFIVALVGYLGEWMVFGKKFSVPIKKAVTVSITVFSLFLLFHAVTTNTFPIEGYGKYISDCYASAQNGYAGYTLGGVISAIFVYPILAMGGYITAYVIFSILSVICACLTIMAFTGKSVVAWFPARGVKRAKKIKSAAAVEEVKAYAPIEEGQPAPVQNYVQEQEYEYYPQPVETCRREEPAPMHYINEDDDKFSAKNLGRKILFEKGEFAAESYRRNMIFNENSYFNHPITNEGDYLSCFTSGDKKFGESNSYSESYQNDVYNGGEQAMPANYVVGESPVQKIENFSAQTDGVHGGDATEQRFYNIPIDRGDSASGRADGRAVEPVHTASNERSSSVSGRSEGRNILNEDRFNPIENTSAEPTDTNRSNEGLFDFLDETPARSERASKDDAPSLRRRERNKKDVFVEKESEEDNILSTQKPLNETRADMGMPSWTENGIYTDKREVENSRIDSDRRISEERIPDIDSTLNESSANSVSSNGESLLNTDRGDSGFNRSERITPARSEPVGFADSYVDRKANPTPYEPEVKAEEKPKHVWKKYVRPSLDLLDDYPENSNVNTGEIEDNKRIIVQALSRYKISSEISNVTVGPSITRYDVIIHDKTNIKRSLGYRDSIAMELKKENVNAYLNYSKGALSIEVPNNSRAIVGLKNMLASSKFLNSKQNSLTFSLGKNIDGEVVCPDITKMPHLLVAGTTGSGKSICLSALLVSLLFKYGPEELRLILVDPKQVEFISYDKLPHLMINEIIYDVDKAIKALNWAIKEMDRRYALFKEMTEAGIATKNLDEYNAHLPAGEEKLPKIVVVLDEFGDLMLQAKRDIESRIIKLVQKARASGIHLILATQRPSVDCITGLIKSNLPTRIGFKVNSFDDSRTIFDIGGAEKLLGKGDAYFRSAENPYLSRIQCCFIDTHEVQNVTDFVKSHNEAYYDQSVSDFINTVESDEPAGGSLDGDDGETKIDDTFINALKYCVTSNQASVSMIQRRFPVGYIKACKIIDWMQNMNYVTPSEGSKPRKVLLSKEEFFNIYGDVDD